MEGVALVDHHVVVIAQRQDQRGDAGHHLVGARRRETEDLAEDVTPPNCQVVVVLHDGGPAAFQQPANMVDGGGQRAMGREVAGARPVEFVAEAGGVGQGEGHAVADGQRVNVSLPVLANVKEGRAFGGAQPLVAVARGVGGTQFVQVQRNHADAVSSVEQHGNALPLQLRREFSVRHQEARGAGDGVDHCQHGAVRDGAQHRFHDDVRALDGKRKRNGDDLGSPALGYEVNRVAAGLVGVVGDEDFIALVEHQRAHDGVHARSGVVHQRQIVGAAREHLGQGVPSSRHLFEAFAVEESHGLVFHAVLPAALLFANRRRRGAKGAVVEKHRLGVEPPMDGQIAARGAVHALRREEAKHQLSLSVAVSNMD